MTNISAYPGDTNVNSHLQAKRSFTYLWLIFVLIAAIAGIADITHFQKLPEQFIGHGDQANTAIVARNMAEGRGAVTDSVWLMTNGGISGNAIPQPESYWSIYVAFIISIFFRLFGDNFAALLLPAVLAKTAIAGLATAITLRLTKNTIAGLATASFLLMHPAMTAYVNGLSDIYLTLCVLVTCILLISATRSPSRYKYLVIGIVIGIAIGIKPSGGLLVGLLLCCFMLSGNFQGLLARAGLAGIGILLGLAPVMYHNQQAFGSIISPAYALVGEAGRITYVTGDHNRGLFDPEPLQASTENPSDIKSRLGQNISYAILFIRTFHAGDIVPAWQLPFIFLAILLMLRQIRTLSFFRDTSYENQFFSLAMLMLAAGVALGIVIHTESRYWNFLVPLLMVVTACTMVRISKYLPLFVVITSIFSFMLVQRYYVPIKIPDGMALAKSKIPANAVVLTPDPWEFSFHTRLKAVVLPYTKKPEILRDISERYHAEYIVLIDGNIRNAFYSPLLEGHLPNYLSAVYRDQHLVIAKFNWQ